MTPSTVSRLALAAAACLALGGSAQAAPLTYFDTVFGTDYAYFSTGGMRGIGSGSIAVSGVSGTVNRVVMHWHGPTNSTSPTAGATVTVNGTTVVGTNIGFAADNCWGFQNSQAYVADVTALVSGNGVYSLTNFRNSAADVNGVSFQVFYDDGNAANDRDVVMFHGNDSNISSAFDPDLWSATLNGINYQGGPASVVLGVADGQTFSDAPVYFNTTGNVLFPSDSFSGLNNPGGAPGLYDMRDADIASFLGLGINNCRIFTTSVGGDCLGLITASFNLPAGAAPSQPTVPEPTTMLLLGSTFGLVARRLRRQ